MPSCAIKWCGNNSRKNNYKKDNITFHRFPSDVNTKKIWISKTMRGEDWYPNSSNTICSRHFTPDCFIEMKCRRKLLHKSIPTLYLPTLETTPQTTNEKDFIVENICCMKTTQPSSSPTTTSLAMFQVRIASEKKPKEESMQPSDVRTLVKTS